MSRWCCAQPVTPCSLKEPEEAKPCRGGEHCGALRLPRVTPSLPEHGANVGIRY